MAGISWAEGVSNGTNFPISNGTNFLISNMTKAISGGSLGSDLQHSNGTNFPISSGINFLISNVTEAISGGILGGDLQDSNGTNFPISNGTEAISGAGLGADLQQSNGTNFLISNGTNFLISNGTNFLISNVTKAISAAGLGSDLQHSNGTNFLISSVPEAISGAGLGSDLQHSNGTNFLISNGTNFPISNVPEALSGAVLGSEVQPHSLFAVTYSLVLLLGLAGNGLSLSLLSCRAKPLSHSYILLLQLALLDTLLLAVLPLHIHSQLLGDTWSFGDTACRATRAVLCLHSCLSVAFLSCLALDLWLAVLHPLTSIQLRATHYVLLATALWLLALAGTVPVVLASREGRSCCPGTAPGTVLGLVFGLGGPCGIALLAGSVWRSRRGAARRKALGTILITLGICALCFLPQQLGQLLQLLLATPQQPLPRLVAQMQRVSQALASCSCCLKPLLYHWHCSSRAWHCPCRLRLRAKRVFTICDHNFGDPSWGYKPSQRHGGKIHGDGFH